MQCVVSPITCETSISEHAHYYTVYYFLVIHSIETAGFNLETIYYKSVKI